MRKFDKKMQALQWPAHFFCYVTVKLPGVRGIKLSDGDEVGAAYLLENSRDFSVDYMGKKLSLNRLKLAKRGGKGTKSR